MVRFVESDTTGLPLKRKQVAHACEKCRRRKKRCVHTDPKAHGDPASVGSPSKSSGTEKSQPSPSNRSSKSTPSLATGDPQPASPAPQEGEADKQGEARSSTTLYDGLNPEAIIMDVTSLCSRQEVPPASGVGIWQTSIPPRPSSQIPSIPSGQSSSRRAVQDMLRSYLWNHCLPCRAPSTEYAVLRRIYFEKIHPLFPIFEDPSVCAVPDEPTDILVQQVISLAAAADPEAVQHLRVSPNGPLLSRQEFCACLSNCVLTTLDAGIVTDRIWLTRLSAALSLYTQPTSVEEADTPTLLNSRAVHQMHTLGLQMGIDVGHQKKDTVRTLFCCLWALDRLTSAFYGRACLIHERDVAWNIDECIRAQAPPFRLLLMIINLLDQVIGAHRPGTRPPKPVLIELPIFEQMVLDAEALRMPSPCLASLEILYQSVAILSTQSLGDVTASPLADAAATNSRKSLAADRITSIIGEEFAGQLSYMPFIPYGATLSLSVSYRNMRHSKVPMFRNRGKQAFRKNTLLLKSMNDMFWKSKTMVSMAEQVLNEMDRTAASLAQENGRADTSKKAVSSPPSERAQFQPEQFRGVVPAEGATEAGSDWLFLDAIPDLDLFGHFDPTFDLGAVDAALEGNFDFGTSMSWFDWQQQWG
ncbi:hypothetical protein F5Y14DRAFT_421602 [Nemania sp. NC0429]|nr:hypothetical protein F5Y14DRAFT_421602 [Nemania sp. NC0429]